MLKYISFISMLLLAYIGTNAQLKPAYVFTDNMVVQRNMPVCIYGKGTPQKRVEGSFNHLKQSALIKGDSSWAVYFPQQSASNSPQSLFITCEKERIKFDNILIGDVWLCLGQSNMEFTMSREVHFKEEVNNTCQPLIRLYNASFAGKYIYTTEYNDSIRHRLNVNDFYSGRWENCDSTTIRPMSAVAYYFAKSIITKENIPIGLINLSIGGAPVETFIDKEALLQDTLFALKVSGNWLNNNNLPKWIRQRGKENLGSRKDGFGDASGLNHAYKPGFAFECGIKPVTSFPIKGIIFYQGESNSLEYERVKEYRPLLHLMINDYRKKWKQPDLPFYWIQLSSIDTARYAAQYWPLFRDEQRKLLDEVSNGGMAVCSDIGSKYDVHPTNKKEVGQRLAQWALQQVYKENVIPSGPLPLHAKYRNGKVMISFKYLAEGLRTSDGKALRGFSIDGNNKMSAMIYHKKIVLLHVSKKPEFVYYAWESFTNANLINTASLPASTFKIKVE
jgi:sialate O-acetylesterase